MDTQMLIGSRFEAGTETEELILNPKTGEHDPRPAEASHAQIDAAVDAAEKAFGSLVDDHARPALRLSSADRRCDREGCGRLLQRWRR